jgi:hypothetical protein
MLMIVEWCRSRSRMAVAITWSPKTWPQPVRLWLEVIRIEPRS